MTPGYRRHLQGAVAASAAPYGYILTIWTTGAITTHATGGAPSSADALLTLVGAVTGFLLVGAIAYRGVHQALDPGPRDPVKVWAGAHLPSVGLSITVAAVLSSLFHGAVLWPLVGFSATTTYLSVLGLQFLAAGRRAPLVPLESDRTS